MLCGDRLNAGDPNAAVDQKPDKATDSVLKTIFLWLHHEFGDFTSLGNTLPCGRQEDVSSCGVCAINALAHNLFSDPLFVHARRRLLRLEYFNLLAREQISTCVSTRCQ